MGRLGTGWTGWERISAIGDGTERSQRLAWKGERGARLIRALHIDADASTAALAPRQRVNRLNTVHESLRQREQRARLGKRRVVSPTRQRRDELHTGTLLSSSSQPISPVKHAPLTCAARCSRTTTAAAQQGHTPYRNGTSSTLVSSGPRTPTSPQLESACGADERGAGRRASNMTRSVYHQDTRGTPIIASATGSLPRDPSQAHPPGPT